MPIRFPAPLQPGDRIAVTAPSSGVADAQQPRLDFAVSWLRDRGYDVVVGGCLDGAGVVSAPASDRAAELTAFLLDPTIRAVIPPWGGETGIDLLPLLDWKRLGAVAPSWLVGYSDISTLLTPLTLLTGVATLHGNNLMDTPYAVPAPLLTWLDIASRPTGGSFTQASAGVHRTAGPDDWSVDPRVSEYTCNGTGGWRRLDLPGQDLDVRVGSSAGASRPCATWLAPGTHTGRFAQQYAPDGLIVYVEAAEHDAATICRNLHGMRLAGFFTAANAVIVGRSAAPDQPQLTQDEAVLDALSPLGLPIVADVECGHVPPHLPIVNGARGRLWYSSTDGRLEQTLS